MKYEKPVLIELTGPLVQGACTTGSGPSGGGCVNGAAAGAECAGGNRNQGYGCGGGNRNANRACSGGSGPRRCGGGGNG